MIRNLLLFILSFTIYTTNIVAQAYDPLALYLTWQSDPTTTMTIQWISFSDEKEDLIKYHATQKGDPWQSVIGYHMPLALKTPYLLHRVEIKDLKPATEYAFQISHQGLIYKFKTLPKTLDVPLRFVVGGDVYHDTFEVLLETNKQAAKTNPAFALQGGDLAYAALKSETWVTWLAAWKQTMVTTDGCLIPMVAAIGNHDTEGQYGQKPESAQIYYNLFRPTGSTAYYTFDVGDYLALTVLDTGHTAGIYGKQSKWLKRALSMRANYKHKFALYHVPAYPSVSKFNSKRSKSIRKYWVPLFEIYGLNAAFEHHDHCYKRTVPIKKGEENSSGTVYLGDGAWGVKNPRTPVIGPDHWYLAKAVSVRHFTLVTLENSKRTYEAIDYTGNIFDCHSCGF